jgi:hypothetical protein
MIIVPSVHDARRQTAVSFEWRYFTMKPADEIKRLFESAELSTHPDSDEQIFTEMVQIQQTTQRTLPAKPDRWRIIMRSRITQLTVAAMAVIVVFTGLSWWTQTGSGIALAEVLNHM